MKLGRIVPRMLPIVTFIGQRVTVESVLDTIKNASAKLPDFKVLGINTRTLIR